MNITVPADCVLEFVGGSISGNNTLVLNNTYIEGYKWLDCKLSGTMANSKAYALWAKNNSSDNIQQILNLHPSVIEFDKRTNYNISVELKNDIIVEGDGCTFNPLHKDVAYVGFNFPYHVFYINGLYNIIIKNCKFIDTTHENSYPPSSITTSSDPIIHAIGLNNLTIDNCLFKDIEGFMAESSP